MSEMSPDGDPDVQQPEQEAPVQQEAPDQQEPSTEADRQAADTIRSISRLEESN